MISRKAIKGMIHSRRAWRTVSYVMFAIGSYIGIYAPSKVITEVASHNMAVAWSVIFSFSITAAIIGNVRKNILVEYVAMPGVGVAFLAYAICLFWTSGDGNLNRTPVGFFILGVVAFFAARYEELQGTLGIGEDRRG